MEKLLFTFSFIVTVAAAREASEEIKEIIFQDLSSAYNLTCHQFDRLTTTDKSLLIDGGDIKKE